MIDLHNTTLTVKDGAGGEWTFRNIQPYEMINPRKTMSKVFVVQDEDGVIGVVSHQRNIKTGLANGLRIMEFVLDGMQRVGDLDRPWVVYFKDANRDKPQVWPIKQGFPEESGPVVGSDGIEYVVFASDAARALTLVFGQLHFDAWKDAVDRWEASQ